VFGAILGGVGLFLLGMTLLTSGLQAFAGDALRGWLQRSTRTPWSGTLSGLIATSLVQSSSATTLAAVGFVGAGLLTFTQALGLIYGANIGTTTTAWLVSLLGLKVKIDLFALPFVGVGAALKVFGGRRTGALGFAIAGFGLVFVGIDVLQEGMAGLTEAVDPARYAPSGIGGMALLVGIGLAMTVVMQSSSAAIATTLAAVHAGTLTLDQAALLAIGQNVGTTITAAIGAAGAPVAARRTAVAHVLFNVVTGAIALISLPIFLVVVRWIAELAGGEDPAVQLAVFHSLFNVGGVAIFLPLTDRFARLVERLVPERRTGLLRRLVDAGSGVPEVRLEAAHRTVIDVFDEVLRAARSLLEGEGGGDAERRLAEAHDALSAVRRYVEPLRTDPGTPASWRRHVALLHAMDHLDQLIEACDEVEPASRLRRDEALAPVRDPLLVALAAVAGEAPSAPTPAEVAVAEGVARTLSDYRTIRRPRLLEMTASGELTPIVVEGRLEAIRWGERVGFHLWRAVAHLAASAHGDAAAPPPTEAERPAS
jgi:phosphate:Na+ symporter